ncbi:MAG: NAD-dependent DNA ligase LigA, partial [Nitrospinae bacterium]|nr:NAD-dependent DNA ligase LigA [Nitrospinota bacterium]
NEKRKSIEYEIDGLVVKINTISIREDLGFTGHHPKWAVAYKFESPQAQTTVNDISVQIGRSGRITPLAILEPVALAGSTISKATLHNQTYINLLELAIGDIVAISKRGDVIPAVEKVLEKNELGNSTFKLPKECPSCNSLLEDDGAHLFCKNRNCKDRILNNLKFFVSRDQMDIENLGGKTIELLFNEGFITSVPDIYRFDYTKLIDREGFGEKKIKLIRNAVEKSKEKPFMTVLFSLGFDELGKKASELLIKNGYNSFEKIIALFHECREEDLLKIDGFGEKTVTALKKNFQDKKNLELIYELIHCGLNCHDAGFENVKLNSSLDGTKWVVTGSFETFKPRELAKEEIIKRGGEVTSAVSKKITHLLVGENPGSKYEKGVKLGITIINEEKFLDMIQTN